MLAESFGTFWLIFGGCATALFGHVGFHGEALAFGMAMLTMYYTVGHVSGAHLNPAVSFAMWVNGRVRFKDMFFYWVAQLIGAAIAGTILLIMWKTIGNAETGVFVANGYGTDFQQAAGDNYQAISGRGALLVEAMLSFIFFMVFLGSTDERNGNKKFAGLAIGLCITLIYYITIPLTNGGVNPARSVVQAILSDTAKWSALSQLWLFVVAPFAGALIAGLSYKLIAPKKAEAQHSSKENGEQLSLEKIEEQLSSEVYEESHSSQEE
jgi:aquaporin Z